MQPIHSFFTQIISLLQNVKAVFLKKKKSKAHILKILKLKFAHPISI